MYFRLSRSLSKSTIRFPYLPYSQSRFWVPSAQRKACLTSNKGPTPRNIASF